VAQECILVVEDEIDLLTCNTAVQVMNRDLLLGK
jgi:hypothetical protein